MSVKVLLQEVRKSRGISQNELARLTKMSPQNIQKIEQGEAKSLTFKTLAKFCQALDCQPGDLLIYENDYETNAQPSSEEKNRTISQKSSRKRGMNLKTSLDISANNLVPQIMAEVVSLA